MAKIKFTKKFIDELPLSEKATIYQDSMVNGFAVRTNKTTKSYMVNKRISGRLWRIVIGDCSLISLQEARDRAMALIADLVAGIDPTVVKPKVPTLGQAYELYLSERNLKRSTVSTYNHQILGKLGDWLDKPLNDIMQSEVSKRYLVLADKSPSQANATMRAFSAIWNHTRMSFLDSNDEKIIKACPTEIIVAKKIKRTIKPRTRHLDEEHLGSFVQTLLDYKSQDCHLGLPHSNNVRDLVLLFLMTGLRLNEGTKLSWLDIDSNSGSLVVSDTKNGDIHLLPLGSVTVAMLNSRKKLSDGKNWVFPSRVGVGHITDVRKSLAHINTKADVMITPHDLRRTFASIANALGLNLSMIKRLMNHRGAKSSDDVTLQYIQISQKQIRHTMNLIEIFILNSAGLTQDEVIAMLYT